MTTSIKLTAVLTPPEATLLDPDAVRESRRAEATEFVAALERELGTAIAMVETSLDGAPSEGLLIVFDEGVRAHAQLGPRTILINASRSSVPELLEELALCAAIETHRYSMWRTQQGTDRAFGIFGRRDVAARIGARFGKAAGYPPETEHYGMLASDDGRDLPGLLARYIRGYVEPLAGE